MLYCCGGKEVSCVNELEGTVDVMTVMVPGSKMLVRGE